MASPSTTLKENGNNAGSLDEAGLVADGGGVANTGSEKVTQTALIQQVFIFVKVSVFELGSQVGSIVRRSAKFLLSHDGRWLCFVVHLGCLGMGKTIHSKICSSGLNKTFGFERWCMCCDLC